MNTNAWNKVKQVGDRWHELNTELYQAKQRIAELEQQEAAALAEFQAAMAELKQEEQRVKPVRKGGRPKRSAEPVVEPQVLALPEDTCRPN